MKATTTLYVVRRESPKACSTRSTTVYQKPRSPFACHVYTTFLHTRNAFLKSLKKKRKKRKKESRLSSVFSRSLCVVSCSLSTLTIHCCYKPRSLFAVHRRCARAHPGTRIDEHDTTTTPVWKKREEGIRRSCLAYELVASCIRQNREILHVARCSI